MELRERYIEAREEGSAGSPHANLDWILGARRNLTNDPLRLEPSTIRLVALWLQDLASDLERGAGQTRELLVGRLRDATKRFLAASGNSA